VEASDCLPARRGDRRRRSSAGGDAVISRRLGLAATPMSSLTSHAWSGIEIAGSVEVRRFRRYPPLTCGSWKADGWSGTWSAVPVTPRPPNGAPRGRAGTRTRARGERPGAASSETARNDPARTERSRRCSARSNCQTMRAHSVRTVTRSGGAGGGSRAETRSLHRSEGCDVSHEVKLPVPVSRDAGFQSECEAA
jgi:hypothetical protein